jgi:branched-chain amino acid transport system substrate-binding protein
LVIGVIVSRTGRFSREGALMQAGFETWAEAVGQAGGISVGGSRRALGLSFADDESEPLNGSRQAERLVAAEGVRLWLGPFSPQITTAVATAADRLQALLVAPDASTAELFRRGLRRVVSILPTEDKLFHGIADLAALAEPRAQPVGIVFADEPSIAAAVAGFCERAAALGLGPVAVELTSLGAQDVSYPLARLAEKQPRLVILAAGDGQTARFTPTVRELLPFATMRVIAPLPEPAAQTARRDLLYDGALTVESWWPTIAAAGPILGSAGDFAARFRRLHGYDPEARCAAAAAAGLALQLAIERAGSTDPAVVREAFSTLDVTTFWGRMAWDIAGRNRAAVAPVLQQQNNALLAVYPTEVAAGRLRYPLAGWPRG